jgi:NAD/NADP transhydrogenase alpha subunit
VTAVTRERRAGETWVATVPEKIAAIKAGTLVVATLNPYIDKAALAGLAKVKATAFAMEFVPRITRVQVGDAKKMVEGILKGL